MGASKLTLNYKQGSSNYHQTDCEKIVNLIETTNAYMAKAEAKSNYGMPICFPCWMSLKNK